ncbi:MAG TPA: UDP-N-acetylmuramoyl-tripeptide--D-alanyl-D-alanine ligase [Candidatus Peribacteraceae bacterium]|nr:UDP-N-acetylmuramoyl-tripeptide--D-alanyl-D-alanine ligase [Candidatus Peribacteraceae bacterium]
MGKIQPVILMLWVIGVLLLPNTTAVTLTALAALALKSSGQIILHRQRLPVRTSKALLIVVLAFLLTLIASLLIPFVLLPAIPPLQPLGVLIAWTILLPLDRFLKHRIFHQAAALRESMHDAVVIGIAGSVGKTTTKELLKHLLRDLRPLATPEHVNTEMGVAQWIVRERSAMSDERPAVLIVEMGAYRKGEIKLMCSYAKPTIGVVTALGSDHLALFGSEEAIIDANAELIEALPPAGQAFLYADNESTREIADRSPCSVTLAGLHEGSAMHADHAEQTDRGLRFTTGGTTYEVALHGLHNVGNVLLSMAVAQHLGVSQERIRELLMSFQPLRHTFHVYEERGILLLDDTYNSSRLSIRAALDWAAKRPEHPRVLLLSDLQETGPDEDRFLEELGTHAASMIDRAIFTTETGRKAFEKGYGKAVELLGSQTQKVQSGSALLCVGRMPLSFIQRLLPQPEPKPA